MIAMRSRVRFGVGFGPQRFRWVGGSNPFDPSLILGPSPTPSLRYYNRAGAIEAVRAHDERIAALEDGDNQP
jgi:hypothetical protein